MEKTIELVCKNCGKEFKKSLREHTRQCKRGAENFFCTRSCSVTFGHKSNAYDYEKFQKNLNLTKGYDRTNELSPFRWYVKVCKRRNKEGGNECEITPEYLSEIYKNQNGVCPITGWKLIIPLNTNGWKDKGSRGYAKCDNPRNASLDRIDNSKPYINGNVRFISVMANYARNDFEDSDVIEFGKAIAKHHKRKF
jgi:hypothetical protein